MKIPQYTSLLLPFLLILLFMVFIIRYQVPSFMNTFAQSRDLISLYREKDRVQEIEREIVTIRNTFSRLDSLSGSLDSTQHNPQQLIDMLYPYAQKAGLILNKVETNTPFSNGIFTETPITLQGKGSYVSLGKFTEYIESVQQSTRISQLVMSSADNTMVDILMEILVLNGKQQ